ncbi:type II restriction endonuclease [Asticcacaulis sp.]|uniref:type II restriction endonuclease n=1 Tax=Asticcacaulis sp. TaxID=1872648 RepID=UPI002BAA4A12|nr:type II restriction endonuclease [Asticcacaulis sp.]HTM81948.1 type II restriction endonuclease [Asticcacaulis sp.]
MTTVRRGLLSELFDGVVAKTLTLVETVTAKSNQHEFQGIKPFRQLFGEEDRRRIVTRFIALSDDLEGRAEDGFMSWSNVRKGKPRAPEFHLYYSGNAVTEGMKAGDTLFLAMQRDGSALVIVAPAGSTAQSQLIWLFGLSDQATIDFEFRDIGRDESQTLGYAARYILDELGIEIEEAEDSRLDNLLEKFGLEFPTTRVFSEFARATLPHVDPRDDADAVLMAWVEREELLFRRLERRIVAARLQAGFLTGEHVDVDGFMSFSLSVQNRRKSRAGQSLENHLEALFLARKIQFQRGVETENRNKPDFLFPGQAAYRDPAFPTENLTMLGSKSTVKDRWRQVLSEAQRIENKHLLTLEPGISENQTDEMRTKGLQLVLPSKIHTSFRPAQREWLCDVSSFIRLVESRA